MKSSFVLKKNEFLKIKKEIKKKKRTTRKEKYMSYLIDRFAEEEKLSGHVIVPPHALQYNLKHVIRDRLSKNIRGKCTEQNGFILQMKRITDIKGGVLDKKTGAVHYDVEFIAKTLKPLVGDTIEAVVSRVFKIGFFADLGPLSIFVPMSRMPKSYQFYQIPHAQLKDTEEKMDTIQPGSEVQIKIEKIAMLDDNFMPSKSTCCVLKAMGELIGVRESLRSQTARSH